MGARDSYPGILLRGSSIGGGRSLLNRTVKEASEKELTYQKSKEASSLSVEGELNYRFSALREGGKGGGGSHTLE